MAMAFHKHLLHQEIGGLDWLPELKKREMLALEMF